MAAIFLKMLNMSITAGYVVLAVVILRLPLIKAPKNIRCAMWLPVGIRLIFPVSLKSAFSLFSVAESVPQNILPSYSSDTNGGSPLINSLIAPMVSQPITQTDGSTDGLQTVTFAAAVIWLAGMSLMFIYALISYLRIHRKVREATVLRDNIMICDRVASPFILGLFHPRIYLPSAMNEADIQQVLFHEYSHLKRRDHIWKPLGFALLAVYWFNPLIWAAYILLCRDIELACDERVIKEHGDSIKKPYLNALINCAAPRRTIDACPIAFGEVGVKRRIKNILNYKKPAFWAIGVAVIACILISICLLTDPIVKSAPDPDKTAFADVSGTTAVYFFDTATEENNTPVITRCARIDTKTMNTLFEKLKNQQWYDNNVVDRVNFFYDGKIDYGSGIFFGYKHNLVFYDHYFCEAISGDAMRLIKEIEHNAKPYGL